MKGQTILSMLFWIIIVLAMINFITVLFILPDDMIVTKGLFIILGYIQLGISISVLGWKTSLAILETLKEMKCKTKT